VQVTELELEQNEPHELLQRRADTTHPLGQLDPQEVKVPALAEQVTALLLEQNEPHELLQRRADT